ncbi:MAG: NAD(P)/FAD-dependent oxidoreductase [Ktedonobacteraceae bacterium]
MAAKNHDVLVIGSGVIGSSIAYHLARQGTNVRVIEARSAVASTPVASWASAGGVRRQGRHPAEASLASEAIARWPTLEQELEADVHYRQGGNLLLAESEAEAQQIVQFVQEQQAMGFSDVRLVDRSEALQIVPDLNDQVVAGSFSPADGQADPALTTRAFAAAAQRLGTSYQFGTTALSLLTSGTHVTGVQTDHGDIYAQHIVLAAGAWSDTLAESIGLYLPIRTLALQMVLSTPAQPGLVQPVLSALNRALSLKQLADGSFLLGGGWLGDITSDRASYTIRPSSEQGNWQTACELVPAISQLQIARSWCGLEAESIDEIPFVGVVPGWDGLTLALGFSGHGFAISPAIGRAMADLISGKEIRELEGLSPERMEGFGSYPYQRTITIL